MRILDRYILSSIVKIFFGAILTFCFLYVLIDSTSQLDEFIDRKVPVDIIAQYYFYSLPSILVTVAPVAALISVLFTFTGLNNNNEIIVLRSSGLNFWQITKPALYFSLIISALVFWMNERFVPQATSATKQIRDQNMEIESVRLRKRKEKITNLTFYGLQNRLFFIDKFNPADQELNGITIIEYDEEQNIRQKIVALKGNWLDINRWKFFNVQITTYSEEGINIPARIKVYKEKLMDIEESPDDFLRQRVRVSSMNIKELRHYISRFSSSGAARALNNLRVDLYQKTTFPLRSFIIVFAGLPFALMVKSRKGATFASIGLAIIICFLFFVVDSVALAFGKSDALLPILSAWISPIIFIGIAITAIESNFAN